MPMHSHHRFFLVMAVLFLGMACSLSYASETFPRPPQLEKNIVFWKKIFTDYLVDEVVIHDAVHIDIVYTVVKLSDFFSQDTPFRTKWEKVEDIKSEYKDALKLLHSLPEGVSVAGLDPLVQRVYYLWEEVDDPDKYLKAMSNIRGQRGLRERFITSLERSGKYLEHIDKILAKYQMPWQLRYLPHVESSFDYRAYSKAGAAGLWQFTPATGRLFLSINSILDERMDPILATDAAARLLLQNYQELGSWPLAITAYNHGVYGMKKAKAIVGTDDFGIIVQQYKSRSFGFASRNFYAEFLAAVEIAENYFQYFGYIDFEDPIEYQEIVLPAQRTVESLARELSVHSSDLVEMNPAWRSSVIASTKLLNRGTVVKLPVDVDVTQISRLAQIAELNTERIKESGGTYQVKPGDSLSNIAKLFNTNVHTLVTLNDIMDPDQLYVGQLLVTPTSGDQSSQEAETGTANESSQTGQSFGKETPGSRSPFGGLSEGSN